jgi:ABC-type polysaccharide/polyol phosphate export permease
MSCIRDGVVRLATKLLSHRNLLKNLILRDLKHRYVGSIGGFLWSVVHPLVLLISYTFMFGVVFGMKGDQFGTSGFAIFAVCGLLPWFLFNDTVVRNCSVIADNAPLITKTVIPAEILPISITISVLVHHLIGLAIVLIVMIAFYSIHLAAAWILLYMVMLLLFAQGLGWIAAGLHVFVRDTIQALQVLMLLWFFFTPILYSKEMLNHAPRAIQVLARLNPMAVVVSGYRYSLLGLPQPTLLETTASFATSALIFIIGAILFRQAKPGFADVL